MPRHDEHMVGYWRVRLSGTADPGRWCGTSIQCRYRFSSLRGQWILWHTICPDLPYQQPVPASCFVRGGNPCGRRHDPAVGSGCPVLQLARWDCLGGCGPAADDSLQCRAGPLLAKGTGRKPLPAAHGIGPPPGWVAVVPGDHPAEPAQLGGGAFLRAVIDRHAGAAGCRLRCGPAQVSYVALE